MMLRRILLIILTVATLFLSNGVALAHDDGNKPGWGFGAGGHTGPPGQGCPCDVTGPPP
jgi:hypothetical protein